jgi:hypothetical protein
VIGEEAAQHAWLLAEHANHQLDFQRRALALVAEAGDTPKPRRDSSPT